MSLIKAYYITRASNYAGYSYDGNSFSNITSVPVDLSPNNGCVGIDPNNGNKVIFAAGSSSFTTIVTSDDNGQTLSIPGGDWNTFDIMVDSGIGSRIIVIDSNVSYIYGTRGLYKSIDGGNNYNIVNSDFASLYSTSISFVKMYMSDEQNGILGLSNPGASSYVKLFMTSDGGVSWTLVSGFDSLLSQDQICGLHLSTDGTQMIVVGKQKIYRSTTSGSTWSVVLGFSPISTSIYGAALDSINDQVMYALGGGNSVYKTIDSGATWTLQSSNLTSADSHLFSFYSEEEGFTSRNIAGQDVLLRTFDSGVTWNQVDTVDSAPLDLQSVFYNCGECPDNFTKVNNDQCDGTSLGPLLCPPGSEYDSFSQSCKGSGACPPTEIVFILDLGGSVSLQERTDMITFLQSVVSTSNISTGLQNGSIKLGFCTFSVAALPGNSADNPLFLTNNTIDIDNYITSLSGLSTGSGTKTLDGFVTGTQIIFGTGSDPNAVKKFILVTDGFPATITGSSQSFSLSNNAGVSNTWTITSSTGSPCRSSGAYSDCTRCDIYATSMEMADFIKNSLNVNITLAILTAPTPTNLNTVLSPIDNPSGSPTVEAYLTYRALVDGYLDQMTHIFPPSQDPASPYYVDATNGYEPPNPIVGGNLSLSGLTGVPTGISFGRLVYGTAQSNTNYSLFSTTAGGFWKALPAAYTDTLSGNPSLSITNSSFSPAGIWNCNIPGDPPNTYAPMCSYKTSGDLDVYISSFAEAATTLAPEIANALCETSFSVDCGDCNIVQVGKNARCECQKTLYITPCVYKIYDCANLTEPVYCTQEDLSAYLDPNVSVRITVDGPDVPGCYKVSLSDIDYCEPLDYSIISVTSSYNSCEECQPKFVRLTSCTNETVYIQVVSDYLYNNIGKSVELFEYPALCWRVDYEPTFPIITTPATVKQIYDDCICCQQYSCKN